MASLDSLPADQRAVLQLVLQRGRSYDEIAGMLSIDRGAVRQRALDGFDALGPATSVSAPQRALLTDYLLDQLPPRVAEQVRDRLSSSPPDRAWARVIASEIAPLASSPLPEIPVGATRGDGTSEAAPGRARREADDGGAAVDPVETAEYQQYRDEPRVERPRIPPDYGLNQPGAPTRPSSRRGGAILLALLGLVVVVVVVVLLVTGKSNPTAHHRSTATTTPAATTTGTGSATGTSTGASTTPTPIHQINLTSPGGPRNRVGIAEVVRANNALDLVLAVQGLPANKHNAYAVWLYNSPTDEKFLGFVSQPVTSNGRLSAGTQLPSDAAHFHQLLLTVETQGHPTKPGTVMVEGQFSTSSSG
jgi:hypothetical protein